MGTRRNSHVVIGFKLSNAIAISGDLSEGRADNSAEEILQSAKERTCESLGCTRAHVNPFGVYS